jgi:hypothetical protein
VSAIEGKVCRFVVEGARGQLHNVGITPFVLCVTGFTLDLGAILHPAVETFISRDIVLDPLMVMTIQAKVPLGAFTKSLMAFITL